jgi:hypothetical protein
MVDVVIASCSEDEALVRPIAEQLTALGLHVWRSSPTRETGDAVAGDRQKQIDKCAAALVCWSDRAIASTSVLAEASDGLRQHKLVACRLSPCNPPPPFDQIRVSDLHDGSGRVESSAWKELVAAIADRLHRPGLTELLLARLSGDESALYSFARRFPDEPQAREIWAAFEEKYRAECASALRDARRYFEQRAESHQQKIEAMLKSFANDFQVWMERERRGDESPKPSLDTLREIWSKRETPRPAAAKTPPDAFASCMAAGRREAKLGDERRADDAAKATLARAERAEAELASARAQLDATTNVSVKTLALRRSKTIWRPVVLVSAAASAFALGLLTGPILQSTHTTASSPRIASLSEPIIAPLAGKALEREIADAGASKSYEQILADLLEDHGAETLSRVVEYDPPASLAKLLELAPEDVVKASAAKLPSLAVSEALKASSPLAMIPIANLPPQELSKALETTMSPASLSELAKLLQTPAAPTEVSYKTYDNLDIESRHVARLKSADQRHCVSICRQRESCKAYTFDKWNHVCYIKTEIGDFKLNPRSSSGVREDLGVPRAPSGDITMERYRLKAFPGEGYKTIAVDESESCERDCRTDETCVAYTFHSKQGSCRLFSSTNEYFSDHAADSGGKRRD